MTQTTRLFEYIVTWSKKFEFVIWSTKHLANESLQPQLYSNIWYRRRKTIVNIHIIEDHQRNEQFPRIPNISLNVLHLLRLSLINIIWLKMNKLYASGSFVGVKRQILLDVYRKPQLLPNYRRCNEHYTMFQLRVIWEVHMPLIVWYTWS